MTIDQEIRMKYLGALSLLGKISPHLTFGGEGEEMRQCLIGAINDGCDVIPGLRVHRSFNLIELEISPEPGLAALPGCDPAES